MIARAGLKYFEKHYMTWQVTYHGKDHKPTTEDFDADSRETLFAALEERGIKAIRVEHVHERSHQRRCASYRGNAVGVRTVALAVAGLLVGACCLYLAIRPATEDNADAQADNSQRSSLIEAVTPAMAIPKAQDEVSPEPTYVEVNGRRVYRNPTTDVGRVVTNAFGKALVIERVVSPNGPMKDGKSITPRRIFKYDSEVAIDTLMNMDVGYKSLMILPANMDQDFMNSLSAKIEISPDDSEDEIRRKKQMIETKKELAQRVANGEKVSQIAAETLAYYNKIADIRDNLQQEIIEMENNGAAGDELEDAYEAANIMLKEYDALPLHSPKVRKAIIRERLERKKARQHKQ